MAGTGTVALAAFITAALIMVLRPWLQRYALAKPNARSSHREPTPQGGGIAVIAATILVTCVAVTLLVPGRVTVTPLAAVFGAAVLMACVGAVDDIRPVAVIPRLLLQAIAVAVAIYGLPDDLRVVPLLPWWLERLVLIFAGVWFVNLFNFMDGIDWMTVAEVVPITGALVAIGCLRVLASDAVALALALGGAMVGFAYFNRPAAKLFLGDVGSLPIGLLLGWLLVVLLAGQRELAAALLLPLYYLADATLTLIRRLLRGERVWQAHRSHFYQRAVDGGFTVTGVVARVFVVNLALAALALAAVAAANRVVDGAALICGAVLVGWLLVAFSRGRR